LNQTRIVEKPRKQHICYACGKKIDGRHIYSVSVIDGDFYYGRFHFECDARIDKMCGECEYNDPCETSLQECFFENYINKPTS